MKLRLVAAGVLVLAMAVAAAVGFGSSGATPPLLDGARLASAVAPVTVKVQGTHLVNAAGQTLTLRGVDRSGMEYACVQGWGLADGPMDQASVNAMQSWDINAVRIPLNEDCWLGINGVDAAYSGANYQQAVESYVDELHQDGMVAILDLHWNAPGTTLAIGQEDMADADHSPAFWTSVASTFKSDPGVIFDLYNEPHDITWQCWLNGCSTPGYATAGMQTLVNAVRSTGATQPVMIAPLGWAGAPGGPSQYGTDPSSGYLQYLPTDPDHQEIASIHLYNFSGCNNVSCWNQTIAPLASHLPIVMGEFGETDCSTSFDTSLMNWDDTLGISYLAWAWNQSTDSCGSNGPSVITDYSGDPTTTGAAIKAHYLAVAGTSAPTTTAPPATTAPTTTAPTSSTTVPKSTTTAPTTSTTTVPKSTTTAPPTTAPPTTASPTTAPPTTASPTTTPISSSGVQITLKTYSTWPGGGEQEIDILNNSSKANDGPFTVKLVAPVTVTQSWQGTITASGSTLVVTLPSWAPSLSAGQSAAVGFLVSGVAARLAS